MHGAYEEISILNQTSIDLMLTDYGDNYGLGFLLGFEGYKAGCVSNSQQAPNPVPSLGCYSVFYFNNLHCILTLGGYHIIHSELQDDSQRFFDFIESALAEFIQTPTPSDYNKIMTPLVLSLIGIIILLVKRTKKNNP
jgi:hypothetical protein